MTLLNIHQKKTKNKFGGFIFICIFAFMKTTTNKFNGLSERHVAQIIRRKMLQKAKPSAKLYSRKNAKKISV